MLPEVLEMIKSLWFHFSIFRWKWNRFWVRNDIKIVWRDLGIIDKISPKMAKNFWTFFNFLKTVHTIRTKRSTVILNHTRVLCALWVSWLDLRNVTKIIRNWPKTANFGLCSKLSFFLRLDRNFLEFSTQYKRFIMCNSIKIVWLGFEWVVRKSPNPTPLPHMQLLCNFRLVVKWCSMPQLKTLP